MKERILVATNAQKVLGFLLEYPLRDFMAIEIYQTIGLSKAGINYALRELVNASFLSRQKRGKTYFYVLKHKEPVIRYAKVLRTLCQIESLVNQLKEISSKIILFGSSARGENTPDSDIDLFIISHGIDSVSKIIGRYQPKTKRKIQSIVRSSLQLTEMKKIDTVFYEQVSQGIILWESGDESRV